MTSATPIFVLGSFVAALSMKVTRLPVVGESLKGDSVLLEAGGKGLNVAIAARRLGADVDGMLAAGTDAFAGMAADALADAGLPAHMLLRFPGPSGTGVGLIDAQGENVIAVFAGANALLSAHDIATAAPRIASSSAVIAQFEISDAPIAAAFALARRHGVSTILNPSPYRAITPRILAETDILVVNANEADALLTVMGARVVDRGADVREKFTPLATALFDAGLEALVITLGADGAALWHRDGTSVRQSAFPANAVDATGCGDAFLAGLIVGFEGSGDWADALRLGCACGAITCGSIGVIDALPTYARATALAGSEADGRELLPCG